MSRIPRKLPADPPRMPRGVRRLLAGLAAVVSRLAGEQVSYQGGSMIGGRMDSSALNGSANVVWPDAFHWWIDTVGSFLVFTKTQIRIGQAGVEQNDIAILGDLSSHHADLLVGSSGVVLVAHAPTSVNSVEGESFLLKDGDRIRMRSVEVTYHRPVAWAQTSRLQLTSRHRLATSTDGIILLGETCSIGPRAGCVVRTNWHTTLHLNRYQGGYWVRGPEDLTIDGKPVGGHGPLRPDSRIEGSFGSFRWEPVERKG